MTQGSEARRPHDRDHEPAPDDQQQSEDGRHDRQDDGGDADAAGSVGEREAVAADEDDTWGDDER